MEDQVEKSPVVVRFIAAAIILYMVYFETGPFTVIAFSLVVISSELSLRCLNAIADILKEKED